MDGKLHGFGYYVTPSMDKNFSGYYFEGSILGYGVMQWKDGRKYKGDWQGDIRHGFGTQTKADGTVISATWINNKLFGFGTYTSNQKVRKYGAWKNGKKVATFTNQ